MIGFIKVRRQRRDEPLTPVPVVMHDERGTPIELHPIADRHGDECCPEHPDDEAAKERLPAHRPTDRDWFKIDGGA